MKYNTLHEEVNAALGRGMEKTASINAPEKQTEDTDVEKLACALDAVANELAPPSALSVIQKLAGNNPPGQPDQNTLENNLTKTPAGKGVSQVVKMQEGKKDLPTNPGDQPGEVNQVKNTITETTPGTQPTITAGGSNIQKTSSILEKYKNVLAKQADTQIYGKQGYSASKTEEATIKPTGDGVEACSNLQSNQAAANVSQEAGSNPMLAQASKILPNAVSEMKKDKSKKLGENLSGSDISKSKASSPKLTTNLQKAAARELIMKLAASKEGKKRIAEAAKKLAKGKSQKSEAESKDTATQIKDEAKEAGNTEDTGAKLASIEKINIFELGETV